MPAVRQDVKMEITGKKGAENRVRDDLVEDSS
jgi:hypothetical protein